MKILGKKIPKGNTLVFISFMTISVCLIMIIALMRSNRVNDMIKKGLYTDNYKGFSINNVEDENIWDNVICGELNNYDKFAIYVTLQDPQLFVRGVFAKGEVSVPPMIYGKYFDETTSWTDTPTAVIGSTYKNQVVKKNGKMYFTYYKDTFEVVGIMGTEEDSRLNHMILMDLKTALKYTGVNTSYIYDAGSEDTLYSVGECISKAFPYPAEIDISVQEPDRDSVSILSQLLSSKNIVNTLHYVMFLGFILNTFLVTLIWINCRKTLIFAWQLCGYEKQHMYIEIIKKYISISLGGFVAGSIVVNILVSCMENTQIIITDIIQAFAVTILLGSAILIGVYTNGNKRLMKGL